MSFFGSMDVAASGLTAQRFRLDVITQNIANANTTRTSEGGPYKRKTVTLESIENSNKFSNILADYQQKTDSNGVRVSGISTDDSQGVLVYNPSHADANQNGYVEMPNVNIVDEMTNMISASRSYEANVTAFNNMKSMCSRALEIGK